MSFNTRWFVGEDLNIIRSEIDRNKVVTYWNDQSKTKKCDAGSEIIYKTVVCR